ncbi:hypothetical protein R83H12_01210 [Fibrobacteria bacterium R8-3-H12]
MKNLRFFLFILLLPLVAFAQLQITTDSLPDGKLGLGYSQTIRAYAETTTCRATTTWSIESGSLPPGIELSAGGEYNYSCSAYSCSAYCSAYISGTPTAEGEYTFTVKAENTTSSDTKTFTINIEIPPAPVITTDSLRNGKKGLYYGLNINATDAETLSIESGSLPPGLEFLGGGSHIYIHGTPTEEGEYTFTVKAENAGGSVTKTITINIEIPPAPVITTDSLPDGKKGTNYSQWIEATDAATLSIASGSLPPGLTLGSNSEGFYISGTPTADGEYTFTVKAENAGGSVTKTITINIEIPPAPVITTASLPNGKKGYYYKEGCISATDAEAWSIESGSLPPGIELSAGGKYNYLCSAYISGTPTAEGEYTFTVKAENAGGSVTKTFTINIEIPPAPVITTDSLRNGKKNIPYYEQINATDVATWSVSGSLPPGLEFNEEGGIYGTPTEEGEYTFTVKAENATGSVEKTFTINIVIPPAPVITTASLPDGKKGFYYKQEINATDVATWSIASGSLPPGLTLGSNSKGFYISGTPTADGEYTFTIKAENATGSVEKTFTINIVIPPAPVITTASLPNGKKNIPYYEQINATDVATWSVSGSLPPGLELFDEDGIIYGTPTEEGEYTFTIKAKNATGSVEKTFTINIAIPSAPPVITTDSLPNGKKNLYYEQRIYATDAAMWSIASGSLPPGLRLFGEVGFIYGTPTKEGEYTFTVKAENTIGSVEKTFTINIVIPSAPVITTDSLPNGKKGLDYSQRIDATADVATWSVSGSLPPGLNLSGNHISGTPTKEGEYTFTVKAENETGSDTKTFTIKVEDDETPIQLPQVATGNIRIQATPNAILLENLPANAKIEVYNIQGKRIYSTTSHSPLATSLTIGVQTGVYIVKASFGSEKKIMRVAVR